MDSSRIAEAARRHRIIEEARRAESVAVSHSEEAAAHRRQAQLEAVWDQLGNHVEAFCRSYNSAFGSDRLYCQRHSDTIVVRAARDPQETCTLTRVAHPLPHATVVTAHRYSAYSAPRELPLRVTVDTCGVSVALDNCDVTTSEAVFVLLEHFGADLASGHAPGEAP